MFRITKSKLDKEKVWIRVSKKVSKSAVVRNKLRRQVREIIKDFPKDLSSYIISVLPYAKTAKFKKLESSLLKKLNEV